MSCLCYSPGSGDLLAAGSYAGAIAVYDMRARQQQLLLLTGHTGGVTQVTGWAWPTARPGCVAAGIVSAVASGGCLGTSPAGLC